MAAKKAHSMPVLFLGLGVFLCVLFTMFMGTAETAAPATLVLYEGPKTMTTSKNASVWVNGNPLFVYDVMVNHEHIWNANTIPTDTPMAYFDFEGEVSVEIEMPGLKDGVQSAAVLPSSHGITPAVSGGRVSFSVSKPGFYTVVYNDNVNKATHIFANPLETDIPDKNDPNVFFIEPGHWTMDAITLKSDQTLYISGGAVLNSVIIVDNAVNVTIRGRGIIDGSDYPAHNQPGSYARVPIDIRNSKDITADGFIIANANGWNFNSYSTDTARISNVKIISGRQNGDGFTFQSCRNHTVTDCFARTWDDSLVLKNYSGSTKNITFERIQVWTDLAQSMEIGYETNKGLTIRPEIKDVLFQDITVLYNFHKPVISIHNSDDADVHGITYRNIVVEHAFMQGDNGFNKELIEFHMNKSGWSKVRDEWGTIRDVVIDGLTVLRTLDGKVPASRFAGVDEEHRIQNVTLRNITILGEQIADAKAMKADVNEFADVTVEPQAPAPAAATDVNEPADVTMEPQASAPETATNLTVVTTPAQDKAERPPVFPDPYENWIKLPEGANLAAGKKVQSGAVTEIYAAANVTDETLTSYWESKGLPAELIIDLEETHTIQTVAVRLNPAPIWEARTQGFEILASGDGENFVSIVPNTRYEFNSATGNMVRVDFAPTPARFVKLLFTEKSSGRSNGGQAAEVQIYE